MRRWDGVGLGAPLSGHSTYKPCNQGSHPSFIRYNIEIGRYGEEIRLLIFSENFCCCNKIANMFNFMVNLVFYRMILYHKDDDKEHKNKTKKYISKFYFSIY